MIAHNYAKRHRGQELEIDQRGKTLGTGNALPNLLPTCDVPTGVRRRRPHESHGTHVQLKVKARSVAGQCALVNGHWVLQKRRRRKRNPRRLVISHNLAKLAAFRKYGDISGRDLPCRQPGRAVGISAPSQKFQTVDLHMNMALRTVTGRPE